MWYDAMSVCKYLIVKLVVSLTLLTRKMVFEDKQLSSSKLFISSLELLGNKLDLVTLSLSIVVLVMNFFVTD